MYPGSLPLKINGPGHVPGHENMFNVRRYSMYTAVPLYFIFQKAIHHQYDYSVITKRKDQNFRIRKTPFGSAYKNSIINTVNPLAKKNTYKKQSER